MKTCSTKIYALDPITGEYCTFSGPNITALTEQEAFAYCQNNYLGYCFISDEIVSEIPVFKDGRTPNWARKVDFTLIQKN